MDIYQGVNFFLVGVGGQGTILASDILAEIGIRLGFDVKKAEIHGMSQRGGSVVSNLRWGKQVFSPIIPMGGADILLAFEKVEAVRFLRYLKPNGLMLVNDMAIEPITVSSGKGTYPTDVQLRESMAEVSENVYWIDGVKVAEGVGNVKAANTVIIGALSTLLELPDEVVIESIASRVPAKTMQVNQAAFEAGKRSVR